MDAAIAVIFWLGQACFVVQSGDLTILTDPYNPKVGYEVGRAPGVDVVTVSHEHGDHNYVEMASGIPVILRGLIANGEQYNKIDQQIKHAHIQTVPSYHDDKDGGARGKNAIFVFEIHSTTPPLRVVHMGDFGEKSVGASRVKAIGPVDVLLLPVGSFYTIGPAEANGILAELKPKIVVPMHYKTDKTPRLPVQDVSAFLAGKKHVIREGAVSGNKLVVTARLLKQAQEAGEPLVVPLGYGQPPER